MSEALVRRVDSDGLTVLELNRPERLNALTSALFRELAEHVTELETSTTIGCVVLRGANRCFSAGHDLDDIASGDSKEHLQFEARVVERLALLPQPVIAAVEGHCYTGALELALVADLIVASRSARFADTHAKFALTPLWGMSQRLPRRVGQSRALEMMYTAATYSGEEAARIGLANFVFPEDEFDAALDHLIRRILDNSWFSHAANKRLVRTADELPLTAGLAHEFFHSEGVGPDNAARLAAWKK
ncbi:enoyl-CoA hydratase/isomerase family protein [Sporichthya brevicatena]|uniref:Enoyl-CoA hydratase/isomerase family protein n=1 Tax=Sporichthya brevicatena TaxID=171442 RepID=A0ABN1GHX5_9ACTN